MLQGVLFDMDGLMFDTERIGRDGWHKAAEILHIDLPEGIIAAMRGTGTDRCREIFNAAIPGSLYDTAHDLRLRYADEVIAADGVPVKPGLRELLRRLKASGIPAVLATSTRREKALAYLQQTDVERYFTAAVFGPAAIHADPAHCVVLEDSPNGLQAAKAAGCPAIVVPDLTPAPAESEHLWNYRAKDLREVQQILLKEREKL